MAELTNSEIRKKFEEALDEPKVSTDFVETMVTRANAITAGREAEKKLAGALTPEEKCLYTAQSVVGRLMMTNKPPRGATVEGMTEQLEKSDKFRSMVGKTPDILGELRNGSFIRKFAPAGTPAAAEAAAPEKSAAKNGPENPEINAPSIGPRI